MQFIMMNLDEQLYYDALCKPLFIQKWLKRVDSFTDTCYYLSPEFVSLNIFVFDLII